MFLNTLTKGIDKREERFIINKAFANREEKRSGKKKEEEKG